MKETAVKAFRMHGRICATCPCELLFGVITILLTIISFIDWSKEPLHRNINPDYLGIDVLFMTIIRCGSLLYTFYQLHNLSDIGLKHLFGIVGLFISFSCVFFCCTVLKLLESDISDLKDAIFFFLLLMDLNKARYLAQYAIESATYQEVQENIAESISLLGPSLTLDTIAEVLLIGAGTLTGVSRVEQMCRFAVLSILINYFVLMTFYPSCLSLILELTHRCSSSESSWQPVRESKKVENSKSNPILQRVKIIMSAGLFLVHGITRWSINPQTQCITIMGSGLSISGTMSSEPPSFVKWLNAGLDHAVFAVIVFVLFIKYTCFENFLPIELKMQKLIKKRSSNSNSFSRKESTLNTPIRDSCGSQTEGYYCYTTYPKDITNEETTLRSLEESLELWKMEESCTTLKETEILNLLETGKVQHRLLENKIRDPYRSVNIRRQFIAKKLLNVHALDNFPYQHYDYSKVQGVCCENVIGYMQIPVGVAGPLIINGKEYWVPMATTEGALVASTSRGCKALYESPSGIISVCYKDGMTRGPVIQLPSITKAKEVYDWILNDEKKEDSVLKKAFNSTSNYARLTKITLCHIVANSLFIRFEATTGDAMGMNMVSRGTEEAIIALKKKFPDISVISISGNICTDKKHSAINWILGRGKSVGCEATIPSAIVRTTLKTSTSKLIVANELKNLIGSSLAGSIGGNNAHAANVVAAIFIACGQDPAQVVECSSCITVMERRGNDDLHISVTMPCVEVGTVGGGTTLSPQAAMLSMLGVKGPSSKASGDHAKELAMIIASTVMAGELSLMASLSEQSLVSSHLKLNRPEASHNSCLRKDQLQASFVQKMS